MKFNNVSKENQCETYQRQYDILFQIMRIHIAACDKHKKAKECDECIGFVEDLNYLYEKIYTFLENEEKNEGR